MVDTCGSGLNAYPHATISDYGSISGNSAMQKEIYHCGPIACGIDAIPLLNWESGIISTAGSGIPMSSRSLVHGQPGRREIHSCGVVSLRGENQNVLFRVMSDKLSTTIDQIFNFLQDFGGTMQKTHVFHEHVRGVHPVGAIPNPSWNCCHFYRNLAFFRARPNTLATAKATFHHPPSRVATLHVAPSPTHQ